MKSIKSPGDRVSLARSSPTPANVPVHSGANAAEKQENQGHYVEDEQSTWVLLTTRDAKLFTDKWL